MTKVISMDKKYKTRSGLPVRILCVDRKDNTFPVIGLFSDGDRETITYWKIDGAHAGVDSCFNLIEVSPYEDFKVDDLCVVSDYSGNKFFRYFANEMEGVAYCFQDGKTSVTGCNTLLMQWPSCRKATPEEIATKTIKKD